MSGRVLQAVTVLVVGVIGGAYTFGPLLEQQADDRQRRELQRAQDLGPGLIEVTAPSTMLPKTTTVRGTTVEEEQKTK